MMRVPYRAVDVLSTTLLGFVAGLAAYVAAFWAGEVAAISVVLLLPPLLVRVVLPWIRGARWWAHALLGALVAAAMLAWGLSSYAS